MEVKTNTEAHYRTIKLDSSSSVKDFSIDRRKYYRKYIQDEKVTEKYNAAVFAGNLVELLLWEPDLFDDKYYMSACVTQPTGLMLAFVEALYWHTKEACDEDGTVNRTFEELSKDAYEDAGYKLKYESIIKKFSESDAVVYFEEICTVRENNLTVVNTDDVTNAEKVVEELKTNPITSRIVTQSNSDRYRVLHQLQVQGYRLDGHTFKSMMDLVTIDHQEQTIQVDDLKCTWSVEKFYTEYYLYRRSYIQAYLYYKACIHFRDTNPELAGYEVLYPRFIVCDSINYYSPLIYTLDQNDMEDAYNGFEYKGKNYPGVKEIISNLDWALANDIWNITRKGYEAGGIINIKHEN